MKHTGRIVKVNYLNQVFKGYFHQFTNIADSCFAIIEKEDGSIILVSHKQMKFIDRENGDMDCIYFSEISALLRNIISRNQDYLDIEFISKYGNEKAFKINSLSKSDFLKLRGSGKKTLQELEEICNSKGIKLNP